MPMGVAETLSSARGESYWAKVSITRAAVHTKRTGRSLPCLARAGGHLALTSSAYALDRTP